MERSARLGRDGERVAAAYLLRSGWRVLARNWRPADRALRGELDLVATDRSDLVICEVKTRRGLQAGTPAAAVTPRKVAQLRMLAAAWLVEHPGRWGTVRFDVIEVVWPSSAVAPMIGHRRDVVG